MNKRFIKLFESNISRHTNGGILVSDLVKFKPTAIHHPDFEANDEMKIKINSFINSDLNIRVVNIKNRFPAVMGGNNDSTINSFGALVDIAQEIAPGRYYNYMTVPIDVLTPISTSPNLPPIPKSVKYDNKVQITPGVPNKAEEDNEFSTGKQTRKSLVGTKLASGDRELNNKNTVIPSKPAEGQRDPASYTARYMVKKSRA